MKPTLFLCLLLLYGARSAAQQSMAATYGLDTNLAICSTCTDNNTYEYFSIHARYPESCMSLLNRVRKHLQQSGAPLDENGFITFRFTVNREGKASAYRLYLLDSQYHPRPFKRSLILSLYAFVQSLKEWPKDLSKQQNKVSYYNYYLSFQVKDGKVISVAP